VPRPRDGVALKERNKPVPASVTGGAGVIVNPPPHGGCGEYAAFWAKISCGVGEDDQAELVLRC